MTTSQIESRIHASDVLAPGEPAPFIRYGAAVMLVICTALLRWLLNPILGNYVPFITFYLGVVVSAWIGGVGPGVLSTLLSLGTVWYLYIPDSGSFHISHTAEAGGLVVFFIMSLAIVAVTSRFRTIKRRAVQAERLAYANEDLVRATLLSIGDGIITTDERGRVVTMNPIAELLTGWNVNDAAGQPLDAVFKIVRESDGQPVENPVTRALAEGKIVGLANHTILVAQDGTRRPIDDSAAPIRTSDGSITGVVLVFRDVTERRAVETRLEQSERNLSDFFENASIGLHWAGPDGTILRANRADMALLGYSPKEYIGHHVAEFHADQDVANDLLRRLSAGERIEDYPARLRCKDGSIRHVLIDSSVLWENGKFIHTRSFTRDMTESHRAEIANRRLAAIVESSDDAIVGKDLNGIVSSWNSGAERLFGYSAAEMIGQPIQTLIPDDRVSEEPEILRRIARGERVDHYETVRRHKDGHLIHVSLTISPIRDASGRIVGASKIARDITGRVQADAERRTLLESERAARAEAERAMRLRDEFLALVSHELRTPLNGILGWAQLLKRQNSVESVAEAAAAIERGARAQAQLIDDLLDMNRIMTGKLHLDIQTVRLAPMIESAIATLRPAAEAKSIRIQTTLDTNDAPIKGDTIRLQQVVWNLVSNAIKFTPKGGAIQILLERVNSHVEISVADTGAGISAEFLPHVFERFRQADSSTTRRHGGLGLGLAIAKQLVELHGGTISAESPGEGLGSTFHVRLPVSIVRRAEQTEPAYSSAPAGNAISLQGVQILVLDDDPDTGRVIQRMLEGAGASVFACSSTEQAFQQVEKGSPEVILSDIGMPGMDGYQFVGGLRERGVSTPAIAITAFARPEDRIRALQAGFSMHLPKPIEATELFTVIQAVLRNNGRVIS